MARPNFFNENSGRSFPFVLTSLQQAGDPSGLSWLPKSTLVDFGSVLGVDSGFDPELHEVRLVRIAKHEGKWYFYFLLSDNGLSASQYWLVFHRDEGSTDYVTSFEEAIPLSQAYPDDVGEVSVSVSGDPCSQTVPWSGYLTTGDLTEFEAWMGASTLNISQYATIEPALNQSNTGSFVNSVSVANADRTRSETPDACRNLVWKVAPEDVYVRETCITGPIRFEEGYNASIEQSQTQNLVRVGAAVGAGAGEACDQVATHDGELPPLGGVNLDGAPACNEVIRSINGIGGRIVQIFAGNGVVVTPNPGDNSITVDVDLNSLKACIEFDDPVDESLCSFASDTTESCGPI